MIFSEEESNIKCLQVFDVVLISIEDDAFRQSDNLFKLWEPPAGEFLPKSIRFSTVEKQVVDCLFFSFV